MPDTLIPTPPLSSLSTTLQPVDALINEVASLIGGDDDPDGTQKALTCLDRAADRLNMGGVWLLRQKEASFTSFTASQSTLTMPSDWGWPTDRGFAYDSNGTLMRLLEWRPWEQYRTQSVDTAVSGVPEILAIKNELEALIYLFPYIDTNKVTTIRLPYMARVQRPSEAAGSTLYLLPEVREALLTGAEYFIMRYRYKNQPNIWLSFSNEFDRVTAKAISATWRYQQSLHLNAVPDENGMLTPSSDALTPGPVYLRIG